MERTEKLSHERLDRLVASLSETSQLISKLQGDAELYKQVMGLTPPEVEAVQHLLRKELAAQTRKAFWFNILFGVLLNAVFFALGIWFSLYLKGH